MSSKLAAAGARSAVRKWTIGALVTGAIATVATAGTFASFSATTTNDGNVFTTGAIELSNTVDTGTSCISGYTGPGTGSPAANLDSNTNTACDKVLNLLVQKPGASSTATVALANTGDFPGALQFFLPGATAADQCVNTTTVTPAGSGDLCSKLAVTIQEVDAGGTPQTGCVFPFHATNQCAAGGTLTALAASATAAAPAPATPIALAKDSTKYFEITVTFPNGGFDGNGNGVDNPFQNRSAAFDLTWRLKEA